MVALFRKVFLSFLFLLSAGNKSSGGGRRKRYQITGSGKNITTKHDAEICGRKNAKNVEKVNKII